LFLNRRSKKASWFTSIIAAMVVVLAGLTPANATHLRGALGTVTYNHTTNKVVLESVLLEATTWTSADTFFTFPTITRVDRTTGAQTSVAPCTGQTTTATASPTAINSANTLPNATFSDKTSQPLFYINTSRFTIDVSCVNFNKNFDYIFSQTAGNRINGIKNTTNLTVQVESKIRIDGVNDSSAPVYNSGLMTNVSYDATVGNFFTTNLNALAGGLNGTVAQGAQVSYSLINDQTSALGGYGSSRIPCSDFNTTTGVLRIGASLCVGTENYSTAFNGGTAAAPIYYALKTRATDAAGQYMTRDVLLAFAGNTGNRAPVFATPTASPAPVSPNTVYSWHLAPGAVETISLTASDLDTLQNVDFTTNALPSWITFTKSVPVTALSGYATSSSGSLRIAPPLSMASGSAQIEVAAYDVSTVANSPIFSLSSKLQFDISVGSTVLPPSSPGTPQVTAGNGQLSFTFAAPVGGGSVALSTGYTAQAFPVGGGAAVPNTPVTCVQNSGFTASCVITGLTNGAQYTVVVTATNSAGSAPSPPSVAIAPSGPMPPVIVPSLTNMALATNVAVGSSNPVYTLAVQTFGGNTIPATNGYSISPALPAGLTFNVNTGLITGTPTANSPATQYTITATGTTAGIAPGTATFTLSVGLLTQTINFTQPWGMVKPTSSQSTYTQNMIASTSSGSGTVVFTIDPSSTSSCAISNSVAISVTSTATAGTCVVNANVAATGAYAAAAQVQKTFQIFTSNAVSSGCPSTSGGVVGTSVGPLIYLNQSSGAFTVGTAVTTGTTSNKSFTWINAGAPGASFSAGVPTACTTGLTMTISGTPAGLTFGTGSSLGQLTGTPTARQNSTTYVVNASIKSLTGTTLSAPANNYAVAIAGRAQTITFGTISGRQLSAGSFITGTTGSVATPTTTGTSSVTNVASTPVSVPLIGVRDSSNQVRLYFSPTGGNTWASTNGLTITVAGSSNTTAVPNGTYTYVSSGTTSSRCPPSFGSGTCFYAAVTGPAVYDNNTYGNATNVTGTVTYTTTVSTTTTTAIPVTLTSNTPSICSVAGTSAAGFTITPLLVGNCSLTANAAGSSTFEPAQAVTQIFAISSVPSLTISPSSATLTAMQQVSSAFTLNNIGGTGITGYSISPAVPDGMFFDPTTGVLSGAAEKGQSATTYTITATNAVGTSLGVQFTLTVLKASQTLRFDPLNAMVANQSTNQPTTTLASSGLGVTLTIDSASASVCSLINGAVQALAAGTCTITASQAGDATYLAASSITRSFAVAAALTAPVLTIDVPSATVTRGLQIFVPYLLTNNGGQAASYSISPDPSTLGIHFDPASGLLDYGQVLTTASTTTFSITATNSAGTSAAVTFTLNVVKRQQTISFSALPNITTATTSFNLAATATSGLAVTFSTSSSACSISNNTVTINAAGGPCVINANQAGNTAVFDPAPQVTQTFYVLAKPTLSVSPATTSSSSAISLTILDPQTSIYSITGIGNTTGSTVTYAYSGTLPTGMTFDPTTGLVSGTPNAIGTFNFTVTATNSVGTSAAWSFAVTVNKKSQEIISFKKLNAMLKGETQVLVASSSSGLPVTFITDTPTACSISGNTLTAANVSTQTTCRIYAQQLGDAIYDAATTTNVVQIAKRRSVPNGPSYSTSINIFPAVVIPNLATPSDAVLTVLRDYSAIIAPPTNAGGAPSSWSITPVGNAAALADLGLQFDTTTGEITAIANANSEAPLLVQDPGGTYTISATNSAGTSSVNLVIRVVKADAVVSFDSGSLSATYQAGTPRAAGFDINTNSVTRPGTLLKPNATVTYAGIGSTVYASSTTAPTNAGSYSVTVTCVDAFFNCSGTDTLNIYKAPVTVTMPNVNVTYDGSAHAATATASPSVASITYLYDGTTSSAPVSAGAHTVQATVVDPNYSGGQNATVTINAVSVVYLVNSSETVVYDGTEHAPSVTRQGGGSIPQYTITYNGDVVTGFTNVGVYNYVLASSNPNYSGTTNGTFTVTKAPQTMVFNALSTMYLGDSDQALSAQTTTNGAPNGNAVTLTSNTPLVCTVVGNGVHVIAVGVCSITASQAGDANFNAASSVTRTFNVLFHIGGTTVLSTTVNSALPAVYSLPNSGMSLCTWSVSPNLPSGLSLDANGLITGTPTSAAALATYTLTCTIGTGGSAYTAGQTFTLEVLKVGQTLTLTTTAAVTYGASDFAYIATSSAGLPVTVTSSNTSVITVNSVTGKLHIVGAGYAIITASQLGDGSHYAATDVTQRVDVAQAHVHYSGIVAQNRPYAANNLSVTLDTSALTIVGVAYSDALGHNTITGTIPTDAVATGQTVTLAGGALTGTKAANYILDALPSLTVNITMATQHITFGMPTSMLTWTDNTNTTHSTQTVTLSADSGLPVSVSVDAGATAFCSVSYSAPTLTITAISAGQCSITATQAGDTNFSAAQAVTRTLTISDGLQAPSGTISSSFANTSSLPITLVATKVIGSPYTINNAGGAADSYALYSDSGRTTAAVLPTGITFSTSTGLLSGTPMALLASTPFYLVAHNSAGDSLMVLNITVIKATQVVSLNPDTSVIYGDPDFTAAETTDTAGQTVTVTTSDANVLTWNGTLLQIVGAGVVRVTATSPGSPLVNGASAWVDVIVAPKPLTVTGVTATNRQYQANNLSVGITGGTLVGVETRDAGNVTLNSLTGTIPSDAVGTYTATLSTATLGGTAAHNYIVTTPANPSVQIQQAAQTLTFGTTFTGAVLPETQGQTYSASSNSGLPVTITVGPANVCVISNGVIHAVGLGTCIVTASQAGNANYQSASTQTSFAVTTTAVAPTLSAGTTHVHLPVNTATVNAANIQVAGSAGTWTIAPAVGNTCTGANGLPSGLTWDASTGIIAGTPTAAGETCVVEITLTNLSGASTIAITLEIVKLTQNISLSTSTSVRMGDPDFAFSAQTSATGLTVDVSSSDTSVLTVDNVAHTIHIVGVGSATLQATQPGDSTYLAATPVDLIVTVQSASAPSSGSGASGLLEVRFDYQGGIEGVRSVSYQTGQNPIQLPGSTKVGYNLTGWSANLGSTVVVNNPFTPTQSVTLYAVWAPQTYTISFNPSGGAPTPAPVTFQFGGAPIQLPTLQRTGYTFIGWSATGSAANLVGNPYTPTSSTGLTAVWKQGTVTLTLNIGAGAVGPTTYVVPVNGEPAVVPVPTKLGYAFAGWALPSKPTKVIQSGIIPNTDATLVAVWTKVPVSKVVYFAPGSSTLDAKATAIIEALAKKINAASGVQKVVVWGWVQKTKSTAKDDALARARAVVVEKALTANGVKAKFETVAKGIADSSAQSRRTDIAILWNSTAAK
jgi:outer membrane protein OmpA-like peptidoglycan-associated protein